MNNIRKIIREELGVQISVEAISTALTDKIMIDVDKNKDFLKSSRYININSILKPRIEQIADTNMDTIHVGVIFEISDKVNFSGKFKANQTRLLNDNSYYVQITVRAEILEESIDKIKENKEIRKRINMIISHELNHAFVHLKKIDKISNSRVYNKVKSIQAFEFTHIPELLEFSKMIYLCNPDEIQARIQEASILIKQIDADNYNDAIAELYLYSPINDAKLLSNYKLDKINKLSRETKDNFIDSFYKNFKISSNKEKIEKFKSSDAFFDFWKNKINSAGYILNKRILKLVAKKFNKEDKYLTEADESFLIEIFGILFD